MSNDVPIKAALTSNAMRKLGKAVVLPAASLVAMARPGMATRILVRFYRTNGMHIDGEPNYISTKVWFDGTDYGLISLGEGCTISSFVRVLTHDWAAHTVLKGFGFKPVKPTGRIAPVDIGPHAFIGTGCIVMPGARVGRCSVVGSGSVVRGDVPPFSIVVGSPATRVGDVRDYLSTRFPEEWAACPMRDGAE